MMLMRWLAIGLIVSGSSSCAKKPLPDLPRLFVREVPADSVESVVYWIGDAGAAEWSKSPIMHRLATDVEQWSLKLRRDSSVAVVYLGDNVYPGGLREPGRPEFWIDSTHLEAQVYVLRPAGARQYKSYGVFIPGNHDWGHKFGAEGEQRLRNMEAFLTRRRTRGINVTLLPTAGTPGPAILDVGRHIRIIIIDTAWWLLAPNAPEKQQLMDRLFEAMLNPQGREIILAAHHPYKSASSHGGVQPFWEALGIKWLLTRSGAALQDLNSLPYRDLLDRFKAIFERTGPPLMFAGGHDHVLQVIQATEKLDPRWMIVSGAGSKLSQVGHIDGMVYRGREPGYMRMVVKKNGSMELIVVSGPEDYYKCERPDAASTAQCVAAGVQAFQNSHSIVIK
jgi:hypothetical protein